MIEEHKPQEIPPEAHGFVIEQLRQSDDKQWDMLHQHNHWWMETQVTMRILRWGLAVVGITAILVLTWIRGGWEAVARVLLG